MKEDGTPDKRVGTGGMFTSQHCHQTSISSNISQNLPTARSTLTTRVPKVARAVVEATAPATATAALPVVIISLPSMVV